MSDSRFKVAHIKWWHRPVKLIKRNGAFFEQVGWVWNQRAYLVNNLSEGWIAFIEDQTPENINVWFCDHCGGSISHTKREKLSKW